MIYPDYHSKSSRLRTHGPQYASGGSIPRSCAWIKLQPSGNIAEQFFY